MRRIHEATTLAFRAHWRTPWRTPCRAGTRRTRRMRIQRKRCSHGKLKHSCADCNPCPHGKVKYSCADCNPCPHGKRKTHCKVCNGCEHGKLKYKCVACKSARAERPNARVSRSLRVPPESTGDTSPLGRVAENAATSEDDYGDDERAPPALIASSGSDTDDSEPDSEPDPDSRRRATVREALREALFTPKS